MKTKKCFFCYDVIDMPSKIGQINVYRNGYWFPSISATGSVIDVFSFPNDWTWIGLDTLCTNLNVQNCIVSTLPLWWQVETLTLTTARGHGVPTISIPLKNIQVVKALEREWPIDFVLATADQVYTLYPHVATLKHKPKAIIVFHHYHGHYETSFPEIPIYHVLELIPGFTLATQNKLSDKKDMSISFTLSPLCKWHTPEKTTRMDSISSQEGLPISFTELPSPFPLIKTDNNTAVINLPEL
jgi:hypothetical protein